MAKSEEGSFWKELASASLYKRNQGLLARRLTAGGFALIVFVGAWTLAIGPLSGLANSFYKVVVSYPGSEINPAVEGAVDTVAAATGGAVAGGSSSGDHREVEIRFPTSRFWTTSPERMTAAKRGADDFVARVRRENQSVSVVEPEHKYPRATLVFYGVPLLISALGAWVIFRLVNHPRFAEFLISVEGEMNKVSWASREEVKRATIVVLTTMVFLGVILLTYDFVWSWFLRLIGVLQY